MSPQSLFSATSMLLCASVATAGAPPQLELVPRTDGPYERLDFLEVDVYFVNNVGDTIELRLLTLDFTASSPELLLPQNFEFDTSTLVSDALYATFDAMPKVDMVYTGSEPIGGFIIGVAEGGSHHIGTLTVRMPIEPGTFRLDAINTAALDLNSGAQFVYGFTLRESLHSLNGNLIGGVLEVTVQTGNCIPGLCDDDYLCTIDECNPVTNLCSHERQDSLCDDADDCTLDQCIPDNTLADEHGCVYLGGVLCCGDGACDDDEDRCSCPEDCGPCPVCETVRGTNQALATVETIRRYRAAVLNQTHLGRRLIALFEQNAQEITDILLEDRGIRRSARSLMRGMLPAMALVLEGRRATVTEPDLAEFVRLLDAIELDASPELWVAIQEARRIMGAPKLMQQFGFDVEADPAPRRIR